MHKAAEVTGQWLSQGKQLANLINHWLFIATTEHGIQLPNCHVAFEDYTRRPQASSTNLDPVWVSAAACAFLDRPDLAIAWQQPSEAKGFATNERLKLWGLWSVGSEHRRDANRHLALLVNKVLG